MAGAKRKPTPAWDAAKADYLAGLKLADIAAKYGINAATLRSRASRERWADEQAEVATLVQQNLPARIADGIVDARANAAVMSAVEVLEELSKIARGGMRRVAEWGPGGVILKDSSELGDDDSALVAEVSETRTETGGSLRVKVFDRLAALDKLAKHYRLYADKEGGNPDGKSGTEADPNALPGAVVLLPGKSTDWAELATARESGLDPESGGASSVPGVPG